MYEIKKIDIKVWLENIKDYDSRKLVNEVIKYDTI